MPGLADAFDGIGAFLESRLPLTHAAGAALAVTDSEEITGVVVRGFADVASGTGVHPHTRFQIGSISKSFAAIVAVQEAEAGRLDLHASVNQLLPWLDLPEPYGSITPHHLLTHSSGLIQGTEEAVGARAAALRLRGLEPGFAPGERFLYSNDAYKLVGLVLERVAGAPVQDLIKDRILRPLGMRSTEAAITNDTRLDLATGYAPVHDDRPPQLTHPLVPAQWGVSASADGSIVSNVLDMTAYARMLLNRGEGPEGRVLSEEGYEMLTRPAIEDPGMPGFAYAYGLWVGEQDGRRRVRHSGGMIGYTGLLAVDPDDGLGAVLFLNGDGDRQETVRFALDAVRSILRGDPLPEVTAPADAAIVEDADDYAGTYRGDGREIQVVADGDRLVLREGALEAPLSRESHDLFLVGHPSLDRFHLRFGRNADGHVVEAFHGAAWLRGEAYEGPDPGPPPDAWRAYPGVYRSNDPWMPVLRIALRKGELLSLCTASWEDSAERLLVPVSDGSFRVGEEAWRPDRVRFEEIVEGQATVVVYDGGPWYRSFEE